MESINKTTIEHLEKICRVQDYLVNRGDTEAFWLMHQAFRKAIDSFCAAKR